MEAATSCESPGFVRFKAQLRLIVIRFGSIMANRRCISRNLSRQQQIAISGDFYDITQPEFMERASRQIRLKAQLFHWANRICLNRTPPLHPMRQHNLLVRIILANRHGSKAKLQLKPMPVRQNKNEIFSQNRM